jgi:hypothetical protein
VPPLPHPDRGPARRVRPHDLLVPDLPAGARRGRGLEVSPDEELRGC